MRLRMYVNWMSGPVLQISSLKLMIRRKLRVTFPRLLSFILLEVIKSGFLVAIYRTLAQAISMPTRSVMHPVFCWLIVDEIWCDLFRPFGRVRCCFSLPAPWPSPAAALRWSESSLQCEV
jgi:hypothetical protein